ncbi:catalase [Apiospora kogelbergensis]|uniref:catalase n=1 Tax=Apiospora kogelbergensis TaxID=1337665 RepID=UPI0031326BCC
MDTANGNGTNGFVDQSMDPDTLQPLNAPLPPNALPPKGTDYYTLPNGAPIKHPQASQRIGRQLRAIIPVSDINLIDQIAHITHERIPERLVHAKGSSAYGEFEVTHDITDITSAAFLNKVGKKTPLFVRFSTVAGERGSADSVRDSRGFAFKLYTEEGNLDWLFFSTPVFFIRDPAKFSSMTHAQKRDPQTNLKNPDMFWDFFNHNAESFHTIMMLFSDRATPVSYRYADIFGINTYKFTKPDGSFKYIKIHLKTDQGVQNLTNDESVRISGQDPDYFQKDLFTSIEKGNYPSWTVYAQIIDPLEAENYKTNIFDATKTISQKDFPLVPFGKITLNKNIQNFHTEAEQSAFNPANIVPGWNITPDPILQIRMFAYGETQRYRLGVNHQQLPTNRSFYMYNPTRRDGAANVANYGAQQNYIPAHDAPPIVKPAQYEVLAAHEEWIGSVVEYESQVTDADFVQPREFWEVLGRTKDQQKNLVYNVAENLSGATQGVRQATYTIFKRIDQKLGEWIEKETESVVKAKSPNEIPGIVVGGEIVSDEQISGKGGKNDPLPGTGTALPLHTPAPPRSMMGGDASLGDSMRAVINKGACSTW